VVDTREPSALERIADDLTEAAHVAEVPLADLSRTWRHMLRDDPHMGMAPSCLNSLNRSYSTQSSASLPPANRPMMMTVQVALRPVAAIPSQSRYDKLAANYLAFIKLAAIRIWLRVYESTS